MMFSGVPIALNATGAPKIPITIMIAPPINDMATAVCTASLDCSTFRAP